MQRRHLAIVGIAALAASLHAVARRDKPMALWLLGTWQSDRQRTMENFYIGGKPVPEAKYATLASFFGHLFYRISPGTFAIQDTYAGRTNNWLVLKYQVAGFTDSSITLSMKDKGKSAQTLTIFRVSDDVLFVKSGNNLEYFKRVTG